MCLYPVCHSRTHLLLAQNNDPARLYRVPGGQVLSRSQLLPILVRLPEAISGRPGDADVVPLPISDGQGQLGHLCSPPEMGTDMERQRVGRWAPGVLMLCQQAHATPKNCKKNGTLSLWWFSVTLLLIPFYETHGQKIALLSYLNQHSVKQQIVSKKSNIKGSI